MDAFVKNKAIAGIGTDILYLNRIQKVYSRFGERFPRRILGEQELEKFFSSF